MEQLGGILGSEVVATTGGHVPDAAVDGEGGLEGWHRAKVLYPTEFRDDVVRVARNREPGVTIEQIARDFGVHSMTLRKWLSRADIDVLDRGA